jgi:formylglycine-generating enzyme required for sulfatase activity
LVFRLPTEAGWEYACRGGSAAKTRFSWGDDLGYSELGTHVWHVGSSGGMTHGTGELKPPNAFGLYNMSGNVWEWCADDPHTNYTGAPTDGSAWVNSPRDWNRILRGGAWNNFGSGLKLRSAYRFDWGRGLHSNVFGLRLVLAAP